MLLEPGEVHRNTKTPPPCNFSVVQIDPKLVNDAASELGLVPNPHLKEAVTADQRLYSAFVAFHASLDEETTSLNRQSLLTECIGALLANCCEETARPAATASRRSLVRARDFMAQHFPEKISLDQLAGVSELSRFHFLREFTREFGLSPHVYQTNLRISKARHLLKSGMHADDVAAKVGFSDQSHLIHHFKTAMGVTPGRYTTMISFHGKVQSR
jgi:AraC-like DNA-binding protein